MTKEQFSFIANTSFEIRTLFRNVSFDVADFIACQSALETGYGTSKIYVENHNLFGMKNPSVRITISVGENRGHAVYSFRPDSIVDYFLWLENSKFNQSTLSDLEQFRNKLAKSSFNPAKLDYVKKIDSIFLIYKSMCETDLPF